jgi:hypothetical protein
MASWLARRSAVPQHRLRRQQTLVAPTRTPAVGAPITLVSATFGQAAIEGAI